MSTTPKTLLKKLEALPTQRRAEVEDFIDFLRDRDVERRLVRSALTVSESALKKIWDNPLDAEYDHL